MASSVYKKGSSGDVNFNMTPMIDCTFQLIIFFILASQTANEAYAKHIRPARPHESQALAVKDYQAKNRIVINVVSAGALMDEKRGPTEFDFARAAHYKVGHKEFEVGNMDSLIELIEQKKVEAKKDGDYIEGDKSNEFFIEIRADERISWQDVAPVIRAGVAAGVRKMNITALTAQK
ncbi:MAG TPA: biopolymer transporter ExbD [Phycisphaerae bacterium]|nr:biopolymer transporter ExbD [Phycisphaerae bacterium]